MTKGIGASQAPHFRRQSHLRNAYGIEQEHYEAQLDEQEGECAICGRDMVLEYIIFPAPAGKVKRLVVDHDHHHCPDTKKSNPCCLRGLLCTSCNTGLGAFKDDPDTLRSAAQYVESGGVWVR